MLIFTIGDLIDVGLGIVCGIIATKASEPFFRGVQRQGLRKYVRSWFSDDSDFTKKSNLPHTDSIDLKIYSNQILTLDHQKRKGQA